MRGSPKGFEIYETKDYRKALRGLYEAQRLCDKTLTYQKLAEQTRIPKSYLSKVLSETANLNADQAYALGEALNLQREELRYFLLLLERARCGLKKRQQDLDGEIAAIQEQHLQTKEHLSNTKLTELPESLSRYYLTPWAQVVHIGLTVPRFARNPELLRSALGLTHQEYLYTLRVLESLKLIIPGSKGYEVTMPHTHLSPEAPHYRAWRMQQDALSTSALLQKHDPKHYGFSVIFSASESARAEIRTRFLEFLREAETISIAAPSESVFQMKFDIFSWTPES